jgi:hypothetical protein
MAKKLNFEDLNDVIIRLNRETPKEGSALTFKMHKNKFTKDMEQGIPSGQVSNIGMNYNSHNFDIAFINGLYGFCGPGFIRDNEIRDGLIDLMNLEE